MNDREFIMLKKIEKDLNNRIINWIIWWSYLGDYRPNFFQNIKKISLEAYTHILDQREKIKKRYRN